MSQTEPQDRPERLNKILAHAGYGSRRQVDDLILAGRVSIDGRTVRELGVRVLAAQRITVDSEPVRVEKPVYYAVNKPRGYLSTNFDPSNRPLVVELVPQVAQRIYTVGRLDEASEGLILLTNDGELTHRLLHPRYGVEKTYQVRVAGFPTTEDLKRLLEGVWLSEGRVRAKKVKRLKTQKQTTWLRIVLNEGKNREIRRMLAKLGHKVLTLRRIAVGPILLGPLPPGKSRRLRPEEVEALRDAAERREKPEESRQKQRQTPPRAASPAPRVQGMGSKNDGRISRVQGTGSKRSNPSPSRGEGSRSSSLTPNAAPRQRGTKIKPPHPQSLARERGERKSRTPPGGLRARGIASRHKANRKNHD